MVSIIILSWNRKDEILKTLSDLRNQTYKEFDIIVVDQCSTDGGDKEIEVRFPEVHLIRTYKNFGVPGGRNIGAANAKGEILVFLDNDASFNNDAISRIVDYFKENPSIGITGFKILNAFSGELDLTSWAYQKNRLKDNNKEFETFTYCGAGHAIRKEVFQRVGFYWDELFFGWEETELSIRALNNDFTITYNPAIVVHHRISPEKRTIRTIHQCLALRNSLWWLWKYMPIAYSLPQTVLRIAAYVIKAIKLKCLLQMLFYSIIAFNKFHLIFRNENKISRKAFLRYISLSSKGSFLEQMKFLLLK